MEWFCNLFIGEGISHTILILALVIAMGILLGRIKIAGVSLGITWILFVGIFASHIGMTVDAHTLHFVKEFGLILFVYSVGMQVGPGFFSSFKKGGVTLNLLATGIVLLGVLTAYLIHVITGESLVTMIGVLSGAVTNTPGLGAAQQAYADATGTSDPNIALGYAVAYPLGVVGIIMSIIMMRVFFNIKFDKETDDVAKKNKESEDNVELATIVVKNPALFGKTIDGISKLVGRKFIVSRICHTAVHQIEMAGNNTVLAEDDKIFVVAAPEDLEAIIAFIGVKFDMDQHKWEELNGKYISRRIMLTKPALNGKRLGSLEIRQNYGVTITRVNRAGVDLIATPDLMLQMGDRVTVVGDEVRINQVSSILGNSMKRLREPNLIPIFFGIVVGVILGSIPFTFPGIPQPVKLGLAGGPLIIAILVSKFGPKYKLVTYTTFSANMMLREIGISLFLAAVGLGAGEGFVETIANGGYMWVLYGFIITVLPLFIIGTIGRLVYKMNYFTLMGLIAGSTTDPPALAYSNAYSENNIPSVAYATVYPLTMFLRVLTAQVMMLIALG